MKINLLQQIVMLSKYAFIGLFLQTLTFSLLLGSEINAQENKSVREVFIKINLENANIFEIFQRIESKTDFVFNYEKKDISPSSKFSITGKRKSVAEILMEVSKEAKLKFRQVNNNINVNKLTKKLHSEVKIEVIIDGITITGKVTSSEDSEGLPGVNVVVKGTMQGSVTDVEGNYKLEAPDENSILVFSSVGYLSEEITVGNQTVIDLTMTQDITALGEIVVVGYGSKSRKLLTNAVSTVNSDQIVDRAVVSFTEALVGQVAGVQIQQISGAPGTGPSIKIRGVGSITGSGQPLYVIDGVPIDNTITSTAMSGASGQPPLNPMATINPNDIESINILKDASSTAIYGSRGSNGVIIITTKQGVQGKARVSATVTYGMQTVERKVDMMNTEEWVEMETNRRNWTWVLYGQGDNRQLDDPNSVRNSPFLKIPLEFSDPSNYPDTDWQDAIFDVAPWKTISLSASGGNEKTRYYISGDYVDQEGIILNSGFTKFSLRANVNTDISKKVRIGFNITPTYSVTKMSQASGWGGIISHGILSIPPSYSVYKEDGSYEFEPPSMTFEDGTSMKWYHRNPVAMAKENDLDLKQFRVLASTYLSWNITDDLVFKTSLSADINYMAQDRFYPTTSVRPGTGRTIGSAARSYNLNWVNENTFTYTKTINGVHNFSALAGFNAQKANTDFISMLGRDFPNNDVSTLNASATIQSGTGSKSEWSLLSLLARVNYDYDRKYMFTATVRRDGSSRFGADAKWGTFPSASVGWRISEEDFLSSSSTLSELKLRASYGLSGSDDISNYGSFGSVGSRNYILGSGAGGIAPGLVQNSISNPLLSWEQTKELDIGMELGLFNDRIFINADYYNSLTTGLLLQVPIPNINGFGSSLQNIGEVRNKGFEFTVDGRVIEKGDFNWNLNFNISFNTNLVEKMGLSEAPIIDGPAGFHDAAYITKVGEPVGSFYGYKTEGIYMTQAEADADPAKFNLAGAGDWNYVDVSGPDGVPDGIMSSYDRTVIGNNVPDFIYGFSSNMTYKGFDFSFTIHGVEGASVMNGNLRSMYRWYAGQNKNYWKSEAEPGDGQTPKPGGITPNRNASSWYVEDASFLRIKNLTFGYTVPANLFNGKVSKLRIYTNVQNLYTFTTYPLYNPEVNSNEGRDAQLTPGAALGEYPVPRTVTFGLNLQF